MAAAWFYSRNREQFGPASEEQLRELAASGDLRAVDLVWCEGMADWLPASRVRSLWTSAAPARTADIVPGFPPLTGPNAPNPLSAGELEQLRAAEQVRRSIRQAAALCYGLFWLHALAAGALLITWLARIQTVGYLVWAMILAAIAALYWLAHRRTRQCRKGPATAVLVLNLIVGLLGVVSFFAVLPEAIRGESGAAGGALLIGLFLIALPVAVVIVSIRAINAMPRFLDQPRWCVEALLHARL
jgi:hypothetical protein